MLKDMVMAGKAVEGKPGLQSAGQIGDERYQQMKLQIQQRDNEIRVLVSMLQKHEEKRQETKQNFTPVVP